jgi:hypothetical protein
MLPSATEDERNAGSRFVLGNDFPSGVTSRMLAWLQQQAVARLGQDSHP